jgi:predicted  nucleic acid-binding Zn-ribbon protein
MYATEKYVRMEVKELQSMIREAANDLGGDVNYLHSEINDLRNEVKQLVIDLQELRESINANV